MEARAINRYIGSSPRKMRLVIDLIRGRGVEEALSILHFSPKHAARTAEKVLRSAISNFQNKDEAGRVDTSLLFVKTVFVDGGPVAKRISPAPQGRAFRIRKRSNHVTIVIAQRERKKTGMKTSAAKPATAAPEKTTVAEKAAATRPSKKAGSTKKASKKS